MTHDKISFVREYCRCRRIPYKIKGEQLFIGGTFLLYSILNFDYADLIRTIDSVVLYSRYGYYDGLIGRGV